MQFENIVLVLAFKSSHASYIYNLHWLLMNGLNTRHRLSLTKFSAYTHQGRFQREPGGRAPIKNSASTSANEVREGIYCVDVGSC